MITVALASQPETPIAFYKSAYEYAELEKKAREESQSPLVANAKSIATAAYICMNGKKQGKKTYSCHFKNYIVLSRPEGYIPKMSKNKAI
jgi:hypothetical protein